MALIECSEFLNRTPSANRKFVRICLKTLSRLLTSTSSSDVAKLTYRGAHENNNRSRTRLPSISWTCKCTSTGDGDWQRGCEGNQSKAISTTGRQLGIRAKRQWTAR